MSEFRKVRWGYEYISDNGLSYEVGEVSSEFNVIIDHFDDMFEISENFMIMPSYVDYVFGPITDIKDIKAYLDWRIPIYENHERKMVFSIDEPTECYLGFKEEKSDVLIRVTKEQFIEMAAKTR